MHTASYEFLMKPEESAKCHQTLSSRVGSGHETIEAVLLETSQVCSISHAKLTPGWALIRVYRDLGLK